MCACFLVTHNYVLSRNTFKYAIVFSFRLSNTFYNASQNFPCRSSKHEKKYLYLKKPQNYYGIMQTLLFCSITHFDLNSHI